MVYHLRKQYDLALQNYDKALAINPALLDVFSNVVQLLAEQKQYDKAFERCNRMMQQVEASPAALGVVYDLKGALHLAKGDTRAAEESLRTAIQKNPDLMRPYYSLAGIYLKEQKADKAVDQFKSLLQVNPRQAAPNMMIGVIYDSQKKFDLSEKHYRAALEVNPRFAPAANNLAYILAEGNRELNDALKYAQAAKEQMPDDPSVMDTLGWVYYQKGVYDSAIGEFKGSLAKAPDNPTVLYHLARAYAKKGETDKARTEAERALKLNPGFTNAEDARKLLAELK
jgi:tetratricopeptide (TPR) repeat protein